MSPIDRKRSVSLHRYHLPIMIPIKQYYDVYINRYTKNIFNHLAKLHSKEKVLISILNDNRYLG